MCRRSRISRLLVGSGGEALSKRIGALSLRELREGGIEPLALDSYLAKTGTSDAIELRASLDDLAREFDFARIGRAPAHFDPKELDGLNAKLLHELFGYDAVASRLAALGVPASAAFCGGGEAESHAALGCEGPRDARHRSRRAGDRGYGIHRNCG